MDEMLTSMLESLFAFDTSTQLAGVKESVSSHNATAYKLVTDLHTSAIIPVSSVIISIVLVLELARNASHIEGDHQMGVKIIAGTMFKSALLIIAAQNSMMFLNAINEVSTTIISQVDAKPLEGDTSSQSLPAGITDSIADAGNVDKAGMLMLLMIPFLVSLVAKLVVQVMVTLRFAELYMMTAFASLPIAFLGHPDTKNMGVSYLQRYAAVSLQGTMLIMATKLYGPLANLGEIKGLEGDQSLSGWIVSNFQSLLLAPVLLIILIAASGRLAKALVGH